MNQLAAPTHQTPSPRVFQKMIAHVMTGFFMFKLLMCCIALLVLSTPSSSGMLKLLSRSVIRLQPEICLDYFFDRHNFSKIIGFYGYLLFDIICSIFGINLFDNVVRKCNYHLKDSISKCALSLIPIILCHAGSSACFIWTFDLFMKSSAYIPITPILSLIAIILICLGESSAVNANQGQASAQGSIYPGQITIVTSSEIQTNTNTTEAPKQISAPSTTAAVVYSVPAVNSNVESPPLYDAALSTLSHAGHDAKL